MHAQHNHTASLSICHWYLASFSRGQEAASFPGWTRTPWPRPRRDGGRLVYGWRRQAAAYAAGRRGARLRLASVTRAMGPAGRRLRV